MTQRGGGSDDVSQASRNGTDEKQQTRRQFLATAGGAGVVAVTGCVGASPESGDGPASSMTVFNAGSLGPAFTKVEEAFESKHGINVTRETKGSVASTQKITEQGRSADVLGVSDFRLLRDRLLPEHGSWFLVFAANAMSIQYREDAPGADDIRTDNWWEVLSRDDVTIGHSDPAVDPGGYRAVMTQQLGKEPFDGNQLYDESTYQKLRENSTVPTGTEIRLEAQLMSGELDYVFYYRSISRSSELPFVELQPEVSLSKATAAYANHYAKATVKTDSGAFVGAPIAYGLTVPSVAVAPKRGTQWVEHMVTDPGKELLTAMGFLPVETPLVNAGGKSAVPERIMKHATPKAKLGSLELDPK